MHGYKFLNYSILEEYFKRGDINCINKLIDDCTLICSISDILYITEYFKKIDVSFETRKLNEYLKPFEDNHQIFSSEIDRDKLLLNMFDGDYEICNLWGEACRNDISPRYSISLIAIKINESSNFWDKEVFNEMVEYYKNIE